MISTQLSAPVLSPGWRKPNHSRSGQVGSGSLQNKGRKMTFARWCVTLKKCFNFLFHLRNTVDAWGRGASQDEQRFDWLFHQRRKRYKWPQVNLTIAISHSSTSPVCCFSFSRGSCVRRQHWIWKVCTHHHRERATSVSILSMNDWLSLESGRIQDQHVSPLWLNNRLLIFALCARGRV